MGRVDRCTDCFVVALDWPDLGDKIYSLFLNFSFMTKSRLCMHDAWCEESYSSKILFKFKFSSICIHH
jgi:hypothetical protein